MTWQPIDTAPKDGTRVDLWAKRWNPHYDSFYYQRFPNCWWMTADVMTNRQAKWIDLGHEWCATHWMPIPEGPVTL